jgi:hypothetical protein
MNNNDIIYTYAKEAYSKMETFDLDEAGLPVAFDMLTTQQKEFFINFFSVAKENFKEEYDPKLQDDFLNAVESELGCLGSEAVESVIYRMNLKICSF